MSEVQEKLQKETDLTANDLQAAIKKSKRDAKSLLSVLESLNKIPEVQLVEVYSQALNLNSANLDKIEIPSKIAKLIPIDLAKKFHIIAIEKAGNNIIVAMSDPQNLQAIDAIRFKCGLTVKPVLALDSGIVRAIDRVYGTVDVSKFEKIKGGTEEKKILRTTIGSTAPGTTDEGPIIKLVNDVLIQCMSKSASDIHIEPYEEMMRIRLRIDGALIEIVRPPIGMKNALISRIKIMSGLNIAETRLPQDGAINVNIGSKPVDFRVNTLPTVYGEKIVMRILDKSNLQVDMTQLGFETDQLNIFQQAINSPNGMVLVTGPTGSGKTTTLYSALQELNKEDSNIMTSEDPVEYSLPGINQVQMKPEIGLNFSAALRAFLRQDPDIIMVGEIRDLETAEIAMKASLTGHMVLSTLHTNSAPDTISRLLNMGAAPFNLVSALNCITAQRLMRKLCEKCKVEDTSIEPEMLLDIGIPQKYASKVKAFQGKGCNECGYSGSKGRIAIHEILIMNPPIKKSILAGDSAGEIKQTAMKTGMRTLRQSALAKMAQGVVSINEVMKTTSSDTKS